METPTITASAYTSSVLSSSDKAFGGIFNAKADDATALIKRAFIAQANPAQPLKEISMSTARIVKVFIADPNENLPLTSRVLHTGQEQLTDLTDQELFFEVPIAEIMAKHNKVRATTVDKKQAEKFGRDIFLEPVRIRDLKMVVVTVAQF